ncbi:aldehyde dehydrogenase family protein, partial [Bacillus sp. WP8]|uniref:aldehyde dehydrogenase family protein n=1 Tax=Bacillus sp. WP8 TaxID=756828 RepID=UPI0011AA8DAF
LLLHPDADLQLPPNPIFTSPFGFSRQKSSAPSPALLHHNLYHQLLHRLNQITQTKTTANPLSAHLYIPPLIHQPSFHNITHYIHLPKHQPPLITAPTTHHSQGYFIHP